jgi:hypothetical protein
MKNDQEHEHENDYEPYFPNISINSTQRLL